MVYAIFITIKLVLTINIYKEFNMYLKSITGEVLFEGRFHTVRQAVETAIKDGISLDSVNLRKANLVGAELDHASLSGACLWGANLCKANMTAVQLKNVDCRNVNMQDVCLAESNCSGTDFSGTYFSRTILRDSDLSDTKFSCPSFFRQNLTEVNNFKNAVYIHKGEVDCDLSCPPILIYGLPKTIILMEGKVIIGSSLYKIDLYNSFFSDFFDFISQEKVLQYKAV